MRWSLEGLFSGWPKRGLVHGPDRRVQLSRQYQQLAPRLDDDAPDVAPGRGDDFERLALGRQPRFVPKPQELVGLCQPRLAPLLVLVKEARNARVCRLLSFCHGG